MPFILRGFESTVFGRKLRNVLKENEAVKSLTSRDTDLSDLLSQPFRNSINPLDLCINLIV